MSTRLLQAEQLTADAFAPYGDVIAVDATPHAHPINAGSAMRHDDLARIDVGADGGVGVVAIVRAQPATLPLRLHLLERHCLGSQLFVPLAPARFAVVVAAADAADPFAAARCFVAAPGQGVQYRRGTWHHPLLALDAVTDFLVVDRLASQTDCDELAWPDPPQVALAPG